MPFGFRAANAQVRNLELRLAKTREVLREQENDVIFELALAHHDLATHWANAQTHFNRRIAAKDQRNECALFTPRVTVARESTKPPEPPKVVAAAEPATPHVSRTLRNARSAFEDLFKK